MATRGLLSLSLALPLLCMTTASAAPALITPPLVAWTPSTPGAGIFCNVANVGTSPLVVDVAMVSAEGLLNGQQLGGCFGETLDPGEVTSCGGGINGLGAVYCRVTGGSKRQLRVTIVVTDADLLPTAALSAQ